MAYPPDENHMLYPCPPHGNTVWTVVIGGAHGLVPSLGLIITFIFPRFFSPALYPTPWYPFVYGLLIWIAWSLFVDRLVRPNLSDTIERYNDTFRPGGKYPPDYEWFAALAIFFTMSPALLIWGVISLIRWVF